jgi:hypothetical protein
LFWTVTAPAGHSLNQEALSDNLSFLLTECDTVFGCFYPEFPFQMVMPHANFPKVTWVIHTCQKRKENSSTPARDSRQSLLQDKNWTLWVYLLAGPLTVLLLPLLLGPCMINLLTRFICNWINAVKLQLVREYQRLSLNNFPETVIRDYDVKEEGTPRERSKLEKEPKMSKALPLSWGPCIQLSP